ncbi:hypothetical protein [Acetonema longum]|uniref:DUF5610 domain-containing protein n=1 Tax=Acetonema longum DSM 6540 TaxID=1009370 RepID=F7NMB0_9FIRM|nr:hypothetical protein [Acetonema longum]EGO62848.1 hypothetical protein ALO_16187 [Acetonema longum DSM 6540]
MSITSLSRSTQNGISNAAATANGTGAVAAADTTQIASAGEAAVYEKSDPSAAKTETTYTKKATLSDISRQVELKMASFRSLVEKLVATQQVKTGQAQGLTYDAILAKYDGQLKDFFQTLEVDDATRLQAQQEISEDGFWGVKQTSERILSMAKSLSGGDPDKIALLRKAIEDGFQAAENAWGGELPAISRQTREAVMQGLDDWAAEAGQTA